MNEPQSLGKALCAVAKVLWNRNAFMGNLRATSDKLSKATNRGDISIRKSYQIFS